MIVACKYIKWLTWKVKRKCKKVDEHYWEGCQLSSFRTCWAVEAHSWRQKRVLVGEKEHGCLLDSQIISIKEIFKLLFSCIHVISKEWEFFEILTDIFHSFIVPRSVNCWKNLLHWVILLPHVHVLALRCSQLVSNRFVIWGCFLCLCMLQTL